MPRGKKNITVNQFGEVRKSQMPTANIAPENKGLGTEVVTLLDNLMSLRDIYSDLEITVAPILSPDSMEEAEMCEAAVEPRKACCIKDYVRDANEMVSILKYRMRDLNERLKKDI